MSRPRSRRRGQANAARVDLWAPVEELPVPDSIAPPADPAALVRSLGDPPLGRHSVPAGNSVAAVIERASMLAGALAASAGLLADADEPQ